MMVWRARGLVVWPLLTRTRARRPPEGLAPRKRPRCCRIGLPVSASRRIGSVRLSLQSPIPIGRPPKRAHSSSGFLFVAIARPSGRRPGIPRYCGPPALGPAWACLPLMGIGMPNGRRRFGAYGYRLSLTNHNA